MKQSRRLISRIQESIKTSGLLVNGDSVLLAVSGGADSIALLDIFNNHLKTIYNLKIEVAHLNHGLRGKEADNDELFVKKFSAKFGLDCSTKKMKIKKHHKESLEESARKARYSYLESVAKKRALNKIVTAHHIDDQAETLIMRFFSGTGVQGLMGVRAINGNIIRPFLNVTKEELLTYLEKNRIKYRYDSSNSDLNFLRNDIRQRLMPFLKEMFGENLPSVVARLADNVSSEFNIKDEFVSSLLNDILIHKSIERLELDLKKISLLPDPLLKLVLEKGVANFKSVIFSSSLISSFKKSVLMGSTGGAVALAKNIRIERSYNKIIILKGEKKTLKFSPFSFPKKSGKYNILGTDFKLTVSIKKLEVTEKYPNANEMKAFFDFESLPDILTIRTRKNGDRFFPLGGSGSMKLNDFFINEKVVIGNRDEIPLLVSGKDISWIVGYRIGEKYKVTPQKGKILVIEFEN